MSEVVKTGLELAPYIGAGLGMGVGSVAEYYVQKRIVTEDDARAEIYGEVNEAAIVPDTRLMRVAKRVGALGAAGFIAGGINGIAWQEKTDALPVDPVPVQLVIDRSGATAFKGDNEVAPAQTVDNIIDKFSKEKSLRVAAMVAQNGEVSVKPLDRVTEVEPFGNAPLRRAFDAGLETIELGGTDSRGTIVMLTNGNTFGKTKSVIGKAKDAHAKVHIVDVSQDTSKKTERAFDQITDKTDGKYLQLAEINADDITAEISDETAPEAKQLTTKGDTTSKIFGGLALLGFIGFGKYRRHLRDTYNGSKVTA